LELLDLFVVLHQLGKDLIPDKLGKVSNDVDRQLDVAYAASAAADARGKPLRALLTATRL
jgi:hypothetical protein